MYIYPLSTKSTPITDEKICCIPMNNSSVSYMLETNLKTLHKYELHEIGQNICTNGWNTARLCGQILSCCFDPNVYKTKKSKSQRSVFTVLFGSQPICATANFVSRGGSDRPYFLTFLARSQASMHIKELYEHILFSFCIVTQSPRHSGLVQIIRLTEIIYLGEITPPHHNGL